MAEDYALQLNRDAQVNVLQSALPAARRRLAGRLRHEPPGALHRDDADDARVPAGRALEASGRGRPPRAHPRARGARHRLRGRLGRHDRGHHHGDAARAREPGRDRRPSRLGGQALQRRRVRGRGRPRRRRAGAGRQHPSGRRHVATSKGSERCAPQTSTSSSPSPGPRSRPDGAFAVFATSRPDAVREPERRPAVARRARWVRRGPPPHARRRGLLAPALARREPSSPSCAATTRSGRSCTWSRPAGGEPVQVTDQPLGVGSFAWAPDGARLAYTARVPEKGRYGSIEGLDADAEAPRHITGVRWHANGLGYIGDRPAHVFVVDVPDVGRRAALRAGPGGAARGRGGAEEAAWSRRSRRS